MIIAIDFDDTLMDRERVQGGYRMGPPLPGAISATRRLHNEGHTLIVFTARNVQDQRVYQSVMDWCEHFNIPMAGATNIKSPDFDIMIDNRAIAFSTWPQTMVRLTEMQNRSTIAP